MGFLISLSFHFFLHPQGLMAGSHGLRGTFPAGVELPEASVPPLPLPAPQHLCFWLSLHSATQSAGFKPAQSLQLEQGCHVSPRLSPHAQHQRILFVVVEAVMGFSGLPLLNPWGSN